MSFRPLQNTPLKELTTFRIGGNAEFFGRIQTHGELEEAIVWAQERALPITIMGGGSNVLIADGGIPGLTLQIDMKGIASERVRDGVIAYTVAAGEEWDTFVSRACTDGVWGVENLSGIPGNVGAAPIQNINAYGVSVGDFIVSLEALHIPTGTVRTFTKEACAFSYRDSFFKSGEGRAYVITSVTFELSEQFSLHTEYRSASQSVAKVLREKNIDRPKPLDIRDAICTVRSNIGMLRGQFQSAGSFFKNVFIPRPEFDSVQKIVLSRFAEKAERMSPWYWEQGDMVKVSTAFLMECTPYNKSAYRDCTFKGTVGISPLHTLSIINKNNASASDVKNFAALITETVRNEFNVNVEPEVCYLPE